MIRVLKFGGTSVATPEKLKQIADYLKQRVATDEQLIVVVSAMGDETDNLMKLAREVGIEKNSRELDNLLSTGELKTISLLTLALQSVGVKSQSVTGIQMNLQAIGDFQNGKVLDIDESLFSEKLKDFDCLIVAGFQGVNENNEVVTLGRGGSDTTAVAIAAKLGCECEIYTDVDGVYATDPRLYPRAKKLDYITYDEMNELSTLGASVMHNRSMMIAKKYNVKVYVAQTLSKTKGTYIMNKNMMEQNVITALAVQKDVISTSINLQSTSLLETKIMKLLTDQKINVDMISQVYFEDTTNLAFTCENQDETQLKLALNTITDLVGINKIEFKKYTKVSLVGTGMRDAYGVVNQVFAVLNGASIKFYQVTTSEISISLLIDNTNLLDAINLLMHEFELEESDV